MYKNLQTTEVDILLEDGETIQSNDYCLNVIYTPGHTHGHICLYEENSKTLFAGDLIMGTGTPYVGALPAQYGDMNDFLNSLQRLRELKIERLLQAHGPEVEDPYRRIDETIQSKLKREGQLLELLKEKERNLDELAKTLYKRGIPYFNYGVVLAYLNKLQHEGRIEVVERGNEKYYKLS